MKYDKHVEAYVTLDARPRKKVISIMFDKLHELRRTGSEWAWAFEYGVSALDALHHEGKAREAQKKPSSG